MTTIIGVLVMQGGFLIVSALLITVSALINGFVLSILWGWFIVPTLGLPPLSLIEALWVGLVVSMLTHQYTSTRRKTVKI